MACFTLLLAEKNVHGLDAELSWGHIGCSMEDSLHTFDWKHLDLSVLTSTISEGCSKCVLSQYWRPFSSEALLLSYRKLREISQGLQKCRNLRGVFSAFLLIFSISPRCTISPGKTLKKPRKTKKTSYATSIFFRRNRLCRSTTYISITDICWFSWWARRSWVPNLSICHLI